MEIIIKENRQYIGQDVAEQAIEEIDVPNQEKEEEENVQETKETKTRRGRKKVTEQ